MRREDGFTLLEVLTALLIAGIFLISALNLLTELWKGTRALTSQLEAQYALMTAGKTVVDEIRRAKTVLWVQETCELKIMPIIDEDNPEPTVDSYFIADLDYDGIQDLYWQHRGVVQPIASYLTSWECLEVGPGLWEISLKARVGGRNGTWQSAVRQRVYSKFSSLSVVPKVM